MPDQQQYIAQAAAIPYRKDPKTGNVEVLLIRRKDGGKWGIPKGMVDPGLTHLEAAAMEAREEAGVAGELSEEPIGSFTYDKFGGTCLVQVYAMRVTDVRPHWDEQTFRERNWFPIQEAVALAGRDAIRRLIQNLAVG